VPSDLKLAADRETFTVTLTYQTQVVFGKVEGQYQITLRK